MSTDPAPPPASSGHYAGTASIKTTILADVTPKPVDWLWDQRIARGKVTLIVGDPDKGKSLITIALAAAISRGAPWAKPATLVTGAVNALHRVGARKIVVATPYLDEINTMEAVFLQQKSFDVLDIQGLNIEDCEAMGRIKPSFIRDFALSIDREDADAIFVSCGALRTLEVIGEIETRAGKPAICSNQAMIWDCLRLAGI